MKQYHLISRIAIYLLSVVLFVFGVFHFLHPRDLLVFVPSFMPGGILWVYFVGAAFILVLAVLLIVFIVTIHIPNYMNAGDKGMRQMALINLLKDTAIVGFALHVAAGAHHQRLHLENSD
jgi:putative oxidoreductase